MSPQMLPCHGGAGGSFSGALTLAGSFSGIFTLADVRSPTCFTSCLLALLAVRRSLLGGSQTERQVLYSEMSKVQTRPATARMCRAHCWAAAPCSSIQPRMTFMLRRSVVAPVLTSDFIKYTTEPSATAQARAPQPAARVLP
jgi:hypothetical protein